MALARPGIIRITIRSPSLAPHRAGILVGRIFGTQKFPLLQPAVSFLPCGLPGKGV
jgi:hypothetical protein